MAHFKLMFPSEFLSCHDLQGHDVTKTIASVSMDELQMTGGRKETKPVVRFSDTEKKLVLNVTNATTIAGLYGPETDAWIGSRITMCPDVTQFAGADVDCIRIRPSVP